MCPLILVERGVEAGERNVCHRSGATGHTESVKITYDLHESPSDVRREFCSRLGMIRRS